MKQSTLKPAPSRETPIGQPDPIPANCLDTTKRIVRIVRPPRSANQPVSLDIQVLKKTVSIGIQVGSPTLPPRQVIASVVTPAPEPPLRSYWTHKVNLPFPPGAAGSAQQIQQSHWNQHQYYSPQFMQPVQQYPLVQVPFQQPNYLPQPFVSRRQRRNADKRQKYSERKQQH